jgi:cytochrome c oxidase assembly protein subunit 15
MEKLKAQNFYYRFTIANLLYTLAVIVWGAFVRASGSGAGCGAHWPLCNGELIPASERLQTLIEFTHRSSSGISLTLVGVGCYFAFRLAKKDSAIRKAAVITVVAIFLEALLGALLVLLRYVEFDKSVGRAVSISMHLLNTLFLVASLVTLSYLAKDARAYEPGRRVMFPSNRFFRWSLAVFLVLGISGAIAALGDTLFKSPSLAYGLAQELSANAHFLIKLRIFHPVLACTWVFLGFLWSQRLLDVPSLRQIRSYFLGALIIQFSLGFINWILLAPTAMQLIHLLVADTVFIVFWISGLMWSKIDNETRESRIQA